MIDQILPDDVESVEAHEDTDEALFPEEAAYIASAVDKRRREFATVRACARTALARIGRPRTAILPGTRGAPAWPPGVVGSMTHCRGYRAAAVADACAVAGIGIDGEPHKPLPDGVLDAIATGGEVRHVRHLARASTDVCWDRLLFCAKEAVYKVWYPLTLRWLGYNEAVVTIDPARQRFSAELLADGLRVDGRRVDRLTGRWTVDGGLLLTAVVVNRTAG